MRLSIAGRAFLALIAIAPAVIAQGAAAPNTTIILVRHAEKAAEPAADPPLTPAGEARARTLVEMVKDAGVSVIVSTQFVRTRSTAAPLAARLGVTTQIVDARAPQHAKVVADLLLGTHRGRTVLVVGHSNTVPDIVAALGAPKPAAICDGDYDNLFIVTVPAAAPASVARLHYGASANGDMSCVAMKP